MTICIALERYITVCFPHFKVRHKWSAKNYVIPVFIISFLYNLPKFFELTVVQMSGSGIKVIWIDIPHYPCII